jgi:hypothetical protein
MVERPSLVVAGLAVVLVSFAVTLLIVDQGLAGAFQTIVKYLNP